jgi:hypothetical protein
MGLSDIELMSDEEYAAAVAEDNDDAKELSTSLEVKYSDDEARDDHGEWTAGGGGGTSAAPTRVSTIDEAIKLLGEGKGIMFERPDQAVTLLHELAKIAQEAKAAGTKAKTYDLCKVSVANTNLFCSGNVGIPRSAMPQLKGVPTVGSPADSLPKDAKGEVDLSQAFRDSVTAGGNMIIDTNEFASHLRASQTEMDGAKVGGMMEAMSAGKIPPAPIFVSDDNYIVDGHHRWAATVGVGLGDQKEMSMPIARVNMKILPLLSLANSFAESMGIPQSGISKAFFAVLDVKMWDV